MTPGLPSGSWAFDFIARGLLTSSLVGLLRLSGASALAIWTVERRNDRTHCGQRVGVTQLNYLWMEFNKHKRIAHITDSSTLDQATTLDQSIGKQSHRLGLVVALAFSVAVCSAGFAADKTVHEKTASTHEKTASVRPKKMMVPPPPPEIPILGGSADERLLSTLGVPLDYMSKTDLQNMQTRLQTSLNKLQKEVDERNQGLTEKRNRATQFEDLYKEGVVSKRELEGAKKDLADSEDQGTDLDLRLKDVQTDLTRVEKQIALVQKRQEKTTSIKSKTKSKTSSAKSEKTEAKTEKTTADAVSHK